MSWFCFIGAPALADNIVTREFSEASNISRKQTTGLIFIFFTKCKTLLKKFKRNLKEGIQEE